MSATVHRGRRGSMTDEERAAYREQKREDAEAALDRLLSEEGWATWLRLRRHLHEFSWTNQALLAHQCFQREIEPTVIKSAARWKRDGYHPAKGERALYVWAPHSRRRQDGTWRCCGQTLTKGTCPACAKQALYFKLAPEFDASQVRSFETGEPPVMELPEGQPIRGDEPGTTLVPLLAEWAEANDVADAVRLDVVSDHGEGGSWNHETREIRVCQAASPNHALRVLIHELAHARGISSRNDALELTYAEAEVAVECVSYIVAATAGLDTSSEAIPYMAGWGGEEAKAKVRALGALIDATAKELEAPILVLLRPEKEETA